MLSKASLPILLKMEDTHTPWESISSYFSNIIRLILTWEKREALLLLKDVEEGYIYVKEKWKVKLSELALPNGKNALITALEKEYIRHLYDDKFLTKMVKSFNSFCADETAKTNHAVCLLKRKYKNKKD